MMKNKTFGMTSVSKAALTSPSFENIGEYVVANMRIHAVKNIATLEIGVAIYIS